MQRKTIVDLTRSLRITRNDEYAPEMGSDDQPKDAQDGVYPVEPLDGRNVLPTYYGYRSYFGQTDTGRGLTDANNKVHSVLHFESATGLDVTVYLTQKGVYWESEATDYLDDGGRTLAALHAAGELTAWEAKPASATSFTLTFPGNEDNYDPEDERFAGEARLDSEIPAEGTVTFMFALFQSDDDTIHYSHCLLNDDLYIYREGKPYAMRIVRRAASPGGFQVQMLKIHFLDMAEQRGVFRAGGSLGFWDSGNAIAVSSLQSPIDFVPDAKTLANVGSNRYVHGTIITIRAFGGGYVIYSTGSIVQVREDKGSLLRWTSNPLLSATGVQDPFHVAVAQPDTVQFAWTNAGLFQLVIGQEPTPIVPDVYDQLRSQYIRLAIVGGRFLFLQYVEDAVNLIRKVPRTVVVDPADYYFPGVNLPGSILPGFTIPGETVCLPTEDLLPEAGTAGSKPHFIVPEYQGWLDPGYDLVTSTITVLGKSVKKIDYSNSRAPIEYFPGLPATIDTSANEHLTVGQDQLDAFYAAQQANFITFGELQALKDEVTDSWENYQYQGQIYTDVVIDHPSDSSQDLANRLGLAGGDYIFGALYSLSGTTMHPDLYNNIPAYIKNRYDSGDTVREYQLFNGSRVEFAGRIVQLSDNGFVQIAGKEAYEARPLISEEHIRYSELLYFMFADNQWNIVQWRANAVQYMYIATWNDSVFGPDTFYISDLLTGAFTASGTYNSKVDDDLVLGQQVVDQAEAAAAVLVSQITTAPGFNPADGDTDFSVELRAVGPSTTVVVVGDNGNIGDGNSITVLADQSTNVVYNDFFVYSKNNVVQFLASGTVETDKYSAAEPLATFPPVSDFEKYGRIGVDNYWYNENLRKDTLDATVLVTTEKPQDTVWGDLKENTTIEADAAFANRYWTYASLDAYLAASGGLPAQNQICGVTSDIVVEDYVIEPIVVPAETIAVPPYEWEAAGGASIPYATMGGALVYDLQLRKWGMMDRMQGNYYLTGPSDPDWTVGLGYQGSIVDFRPVNGEYIDTGNQGFYNLNIGVYEGGLQSFNEAPVNDECFISYGKFQFRNADFTSLEEVRVRCAGPGDFYIMAQSSLDGDRLTYGYSAFTYSGDKATTQVLNYGKIGVWHQITISGQFDLRELNLKSVFGGRR